MRSRMKIFLTISLLYFPAVLVAQENEYFRPFGDPKFFCDAQERHLSDEEFVRLALGYELEKRQAGYLNDTNPPDGYEIGSVDRFLDANPGSYSVERDPKYRRDGGGFGSWLNRWINGENVAIWILIPSNTVGEPKLSLTYFVDECGEINGDRRFRLSDYLTE